MKKTRIGFVIVALLFSFILSACTEKNNITESSTSNVTSSQKVEQHKEANNSEFVYENENIVNIEHDFFKVSKSEYLDILKYKYGVKILYSDKLSENERLNKIFNHILISYNFSGEEKFITTTDGTIFTREDEIFGSYNYIYNLELYKTISDFITFLDVNSEYDYSQLQYINPKIIVVEKDTYYMWESVDAYIIIAGFTSYNEIIPQHFYCIKKT